ncbi:DUF2867 domain-containing protein [Chitinophaga ginsengisegetis]
MKYVEFRPGVFIIPITFKVSFGKPSHSQLRAVFFIHGWFGRVYWICFQHFIVLLLLVFHVYY